MPRVYSKTGEHYQGLAGVPGFGNMEGQLKVFNGLTAFQILGHILERWICLRA